MTALTVGTGQQYATLSAAAAASRDGDTIYVQAGTYLNDFSTINTKISIIGVGGMAHFIATTAPSNGKAFLVTNTDVTLDHLEFSGAKVSSMNGAGIRYQGGALTISNSYFHDNQEGILGAPDADGSIVIDHSEFSHNGAGDGRSHNLYIGEIANFQITDSYLHNVPVGHELKSRAASNYIANNRIDDQNSTASYSIDLPYGGDSTIENNIIRQGPHSANPAIIAYSAETSSPWPGSQLTVRGNTIINQLNSLSSVGVVNFSSVTADITGNHFYGLAPAKIAMGPSLQAGNDSLASAPVVSTSHPWTASPWDALVSGRAGDDVLVGTGGNDLLVGGAGADSFSGGTGSDNIVDFSQAQGDKINLIGIGDLTGLADVLLNGVQNGPDSVLDFGGGNMLTLQNVALNTLSASDFIDVGIGNLAPTGIALSHAAVAENSANGKVVGVLSATDPNPGDSFGYSLVYNPGGLFAINGANLVVAGPLDFETANSHSVTVRVTDSEGAYFDKAFTIAVTNVAGFTIFGSAANNIIDVTRTVAVQHFPTNEEDNISGAGGNDNISGLGGNDTLNGGVGNDTLNGGYGNDSLLGAAGNDWLIGGPGADHFSFTSVADIGVGAAHDTIADFHHAEADKIDLSMIDAKTAVAGNQAFAFIGNHNFHHIAGELHYAAVANGVTVSGDINGDGVADFRLDLVGVASLAAGDFIL